MTGLLYLGIDGGNRKTLAVVADARGKIVGHGRSGNGDIYGAESPADAVDAVLASVTMALTAAGVTAADLRAGAFRLAGVDWPEDEKFWVDQLTRRLPNLARFSVANDGFATIRCGEPSGVGIAIVVGTGPAIAGRGPSGREWSIGFWPQEPLGATGLGDAALKAVFRSAAGLQPPTILTERLLAFFGQDDVEGLLHFFTARDRSPDAHRQRAMVAPEVTSAAGEGDAVARQIVTRQADRLADYGWVAARRVGFDAEADVVPVVLAGSVLGEETSLLATALQAALRDRLPKARAQVARLTPVAGAVIDALAESGIDITSQVVDELRRSTQFLNDARASTLD